MIFNSLIIVSLLIWILRFGFSWGHTLIIVGTTLVGGLIFLRSELKLTTTALVGLVIFFLVLCGGLYIRSLGIIGPEYLYQNAIIQSLLRSPRFPPQDLWYAGHSFNYYYFGYVIFAAATKLVNKAYIFSYYLPFFYAVLATALFTLLANYFSRNKLQKSLFGIILVLFTGSFFSFFFVAKRLFPLPVFNFVTHYNSYNLGAIFISSTDIGDFPLNNFLLGNLHPYVICQLAVLLFIGQLLSIIRAIRVRAINLMLLGITLAVISLTNPWDFLIYSVMLALVLVNKIGFARLRELVWAALTVGISSAIPVIPFLITFKSPVSNLMPIVELTEWYIYLPLFVGLFFIPPVVAILRYGYCKFSSSAFYLPPILMIVLWVAAIVLRAIIHHNLNDIQASAIITKLVIQLPLLALLGMFSSVLTRDVVWRDYRKFMPFLCYFLAILLANFVELFFVRDATGGRFNTFFKVYYNVWFLSALGFVLIWELYRIPKKLIAFLLVVGLVYPAYFLVITPKKPSTLTDSPIIFELYPKDARAIAWIRKNIVLDKGVFLEAATYDSRSPRISSFTGNPTLIGIIRLYLENNRPPDDWGQVVDDIKLIYTTEDRAKFCKLIRQYDVHYIYLGESEFIHFTKSAGSNFEKFGLTKIYNTENSSIYSATASTCGQPLSQN